MSNELETQLQAVEGLTIAQLRKAANMLGITSARDWKSEDFVRAIQEKQKQDQLVTAVFDLSAGPAPGKARVVIHRDPTPGHKNGPIHLGVNGYIIAVPRGGEFDIPIPFVEALKNAKTTVTEQQQESSRDNPGGAYRDDERTSYPFQVLAVTPGKFINNYDARAAKYAKRKAFFDLYGAWPLDGELKEFEKLRMAKEMKD